MAKRGKPKKTIRGEVLDAAMLAVTGERHKAYGTAEDNFQRIANLWNVHIRNRFGNKIADQFTLENTDVAQLMILMKIARLENTPTHIDSWIDVAGYAACGAEAT